jgi:DNA mismatch repair protein MutH
MIEFLRHESELPYNPHDKTSIIEYAKKLADNSLRNACIKGADSLQNNKGAFGQLVENLYFFIKTNNSPEPDFYSVGMELKTAGLNKKNSQWRAKESMMLSSINYHNIIKEEFSQSAVINKSECLLFIFYEYKKNVLPLDLIVKVVGSWSFSDIADKDKEIIKRDWEIIRDKVINGKAHELSRKDTNYLCAVTSGTSDDFTKQPNGPKSRTRKYALKSGFMHSVINQITKQNDNRISLFDSVREAKNLSIEEKVYQRFVPYFNKTDKELIQELNITNLNSKTKQRFSLITKKILKAMFNVPEKVKLDNYIEEFSKAELEVKTIRLNEQNLPEEDISFPAFKYEEVVNEDWEESNFHSLIDKKFLFVFFQHKDQELILKKVKFWNMPYEDTLKAKKVWKETQKILKEGKIVKEFKYDKNGKKLRVTNFPNKRFSDVAHVRPHAKNAEDTFPLPIKDKLTEADNFTKHCFWLNAAYVRDEIFLK